MRHVGLLVAGVLVGGILSGCGGSTRGHGGHGSDENTRGSGPPPCTSPGVDPTTGYVHCAEGYVHRASKVACEPSGGAGNVDSGQADAGSSAEEPLESPQGTSCVADPSVCHKFPRGFCDARGMKYCSSGCFTDADCGHLGSICECGHPESPTGGACVYGSCTADSDCASGYRCASMGSLLRPSFLCQTPQDECITDNDCEQACVIGSAGFRVCGTAGTE